MMKRILRVLALLILLTVLILPVIPVRAAGTEIVQANPAPGSAFNYQRHSFYAAGRHWVFFAPYTGTVAYSSSADNVTWLAPTTINSLNWGGNFETYYDGEYAYYAGAAYTSNTIKFRRGVPNSDGTITWSAAEQNVTNTCATDDWWPVNSMCVDTSGHAYIIYRTAARTLKVIKNANTDGTWLTDGVAFTLMESSSDYPVGIALTLTDDKVYAVYCNLVLITAPIVGRLYNGSWGDQETLSDYPPGSWQYSATSHNDTVEIAYSFTNGSGDEQVNCITRDSAGNISETDIYTSNISIHAVPTITHTGAGDLLVFMAMALDSDATLSQHHIYYWARIDGVWGSPVDWINETVLHLYDPDWEVSFYSSQSGMIGYVYNVLDSGQSLRYDYIQQATVIVIGSGTTTPGEFTMVGQLNSMGSENSYANCYFEYGFTPGDYSYSTTPQTLLATGQFSATVTDFPRYDGLIYFRVAAENDTGTAYSSELSFQANARIGMFTGVKPLLYAIPVIILCGLLGSGVIFGIRGINDLNSNSGSYGNLIVSAIILGFTGVCFSFMGILFDMIGNYLAW